MTKANFLLLVFNFFCFVSTAQQNVLQEAQQLYKAEKYQMLIQFLNKVQIKEEEHFLLEGKAYHQLEDYSRAIERFETCVDLNSKNAESHYWLGVSNIKALQGDDNFFKKGVYAYDAQDALKKAIELKPSHTLARTSLAHYYLNAPLIAGGSSTKAQEQAIEVMKYNKAQGNTLLATIYRQNEEYEKAEALYHQLIESKQNSEKVYYFLAEISLEKKDYNKAFEYLDQSLNQYPQYKMPHYQYGKLSVMSQQKVLQGIKHLKTYIELEQSSNLPADHWGYYRLGQLYLLQGKLTEAKQAFNNCLQLKPDFDKAREELKKL